MRLLLSLLLVCAAAAQDLETAALGGPCLPDNHEAGNEWFALLQRQSEAAKRGDTEAAISLQKEIVRTRCSMEYWWFHLAESLVAAGRHDQAVTLLDALYHRRNNSIDEQVQAPDSSLRALAETPAFRQSSLAAKLADDRRAAAGRRKQARDRAAASPRPPVNYVARPACPFECCRFGSWSVSEATDLFDRPGGSVRTGKVLKGQTVQAITGEVHLRPEPVLVRFRLPLEVPPGSIVYLLDNLGEGFGKVWVAGKAVESDVTGIHNQSTFAAPDCWGEFVDPDAAAHQRGTAWWVQIRTRGGITGWTRETNHFGGMDGCG